MAPSRGSMRATALRCDLRSEARYMSGLSPSRASRRTPADDRNVWVHGPRSRPAFPLPPPVHRNLEIIRDIVGGTAEADAARIVAAPTSASWFDVLGCPNFAAGVIACGRNRRRFDDEREIAGRVFWDCCRRIRRNQLQRQRWRRFCARPIKRCHQVPTRHGFEQRREVSAEARVLCDGHSGYIRQSPNGLLMSVEAASVGLSLPTRLDRDLRSHFDHGAGRDLEIIRGLVGGALRR
jgi:hypothetical protein